MVRRAPREQFLDRTASSGAAAARARVGRAVASQAPLVPLVAQKQVTLVSPRVGDYQFCSPLGGVLVDQLWLSKPGSLSVP